MPLAVPTLMAGIRGATIAIVATATIAPLAGVLTLGDYIINENVYGENGVLAGAIFVALMALALEFGSPLLATSAHFERALKLQCCLTSPTQTNTRGGTRVRTMTNGGRAAVATRARSDPQPGSRRLRRKRRQHHRSGR